MLNLLVGPIAALVSDVIRRILPAEKMPEADRLKLESEITLALAQMDWQKYETEITKKAEVIVSETQGQSWLQRNWRPMLMLTFTYIIAHNYIITPIIRMFSFGANVPVLEIPPDMWDLLKLGIGGYIVGRSAEKIINEWKAK
ncbi:hypothetical protein A45J_0394 [hot springs metagenome]|uniref:Holin n=1 Tax=hot springs metagenome TaxID=433727 RepID=A0A5J4L587_9ZZZZ